MLILFKCPFIYLFFIFFASLKSDLISKSLDSNVLPLYFKVISLRVALSTLLQLNWKCAGSLHLPIRLFPCLQGTGTLSRPPSFPTLITFKPSNLQNPGTQTTTPPPFGLINVPFSSVMQESFEIHRSCIFLVCPLLYSIPLKKKKKKKKCRHQTQLDSA